MAMIQVSELSFTYDGSFDPVFKSTSFQIDTDWKLGFIGRNGRGKTTFLQLLQGKYEYSGEIYSSVEFDYFPYTVKDPKKMTLEVLYEICPLAEDWEFLKELSLLEVEAEVLYRPFETLSNGEQTKVLLAGLFLQEDHFLLIDEPTNHLDSHGRKSLAEYLKGKKSFILVSHDRNFLDGCVDHILSINRKNIEVQTGNFSSWWENKERQDQFEKSSNERLKKDIRRLERAAKQSAQWSDQVEKSKIGQKISGLKPDKGFIGHKAAKMMKRSKSLESRREIALEEKSTLLKNVEEMEDLKIKPLEYHSNLLLEGRDIELYYGENKVCGPLSFSIMQGERVGLVGGNGSGKSTLLKFLLKKEIAYKGNLQMSDRVIVSYVSQDTSHLSGTLTELAIDEDIEESLLKAILRKLDFDRVQFEKEIQEYSSGQKKKVLIAASLAKRAHLYIWDEPLNFIDVFSRMQIEDLLQTFQPTMIFVEHDEAFQRKIATKKIFL